MSLRQKATKGILYWLFTAGRGRYIHLGPVNEPPKINHEKVLEALDYVKQRYGHYTEVEDQLVNLLQEPYKENYLSKRLKELDKYTDEMLGSLSEARRKEYLEKRTAELQTKLRRLEQVKEQPAIYKLLLSVGKPSELRKYSVAEITSDRVYVETDMRAKGGLRDRRLGSQAPTEKCGTCEKSLPECEGHFGHIEFVEPVLHSKFTEDVYKLLSATCRACGRVKVAQKEIEQRKDAEHTRDLLIKKAQQSKRCPHCGEEQSGLRFSKLDVILGISATKFYEFDKNGEGNLLPRTIRERLSRIPNGDFLLLGYDPTVLRPEWFVLQILIVPPVKLRPRRILKTGEREEDDLTIILATIVGVNESMKKIKNMGAPSIRDRPEYLVDILQGRIDAYFNSEAFLQCQRLLEREMAKNLHNIKK